MCRYYLAAAVLALAGCSPSPEPDKAAKGPAKPVPVVAMAENTKHPLAKYVEVAGVRLSEKPGGKLSVKVAVINHSDADIADLGVELTIPACTLPLKVGTIGPEESKDVSGECSTKLRVYELPDWQFVKPEFKITSPPANQ